MSGVSPRSSRTRLNPTLASSIQLSRRIWNARMLMTLGREMGMVLATLKKSIFYIFYHKFFQINQIL